MNTNKNIHPDSFAESIFNKFNYNNKDDVAKIKINNTIIQYDLNWLDDIYKNINNNFSFKQNYFTNTTNEITYRTLTDIKKERAIKVNPFTKEEKENIQLYEELEFIKDKYYNKELSKRTYERILSERDYAFKNIIKKTNYHNILR